jgi:hypothetical protein
MILNMNRIRSNHYQQSSPSPMRQTSGKFNAEKIKVCIRVRPLLAPFEDEEVWGVDYKENRIHSMNTNLAGSGSGIDPFSQASPHSQQVNINAFIREKELRRRY